MRLSAVWYDVGYNIQSLNMALGDLCLVKLFFFYSSQKPHSNHVFPRFNHSSIVTYVINNRWHHILSRRSILSIRYIFLNFSTNSLKKTLYSCSTITKCSNDEKSILGFSSPLILVIHLLWKHFREEKKMDEAYISVHPLVSFLLELLTFCTNILYNTRSLNTIVK